MDFKFDLNKTVQATALLLTFHGGKMSYLKLIKLLYMADRRSLEKTNEPITGAQYVSMRYGPVLSEVLDFVHHGNMLSDDHTWKKHISAPRDYHLILLEDPGIGDLCEEEENFLKEVYQHYGHFDRFKLAELTHSLFPEWQDPFGSAVPISLESILRHIGKSESDISSIHHTIEHRNYLEILFNG
jgi:uncharacterized phage-associated protein